LELLTTTDISDR